MFPKKSACVAALLLLTTGCVEGVRSPHCVDLMVGSSQGTSTSSATCLFGYLDNDGQPGGFSPNSPSGPNSPGGNNNSPGNSSGGGFATAGPGDVSVSYGGSGGI